MIVSVFIYKFIDIIMLMQLENFDYVYDLFIWLRLKMEIAQCGS